MKTEAIERLMHWQAVDRGRAWQISGDADNVEMRLVDGHGLAYRKWISRKCIVDAYAADVLLVAAEDAISELAAASCEVQA